MFSATGRASFLGKKRLEALLHAARCTAEVQGETEAGVRLIARFLHLSRMWQSQGAVPLPYHILPVLEGDQRPQCREGNRPTHPTTLGDHAIKVRFVGAGEMAQWLEVPANLSGDTGSVPSTHMAVYNRR